MPGRRRARCHVPVDRASLPRTLPDGSARSMINAPTARISFRDRNLLEALREHALLCGGPADLPERIDRKLASSIKLKEHDPEEHDRVMIGSTLVCKIASERLVVKLVLSEALVRAPGDVPVTRQLGLDLLGLPAGASIRSGDFSASIFVESLERPAG